MGMGDDATADPKYRRLRPGVDVTVRSDLRVARAMALINELAGRIESWNRLRLVWTETILSDDGLLATSELRVASQPPTEEWGVLFGEVLHCLRSALDIAAWEFCGLDGGVPRNPKVVYFPVCSEQGKWPAWADKLSSMPPEILVRVHSVQPFHSTAVGERSSIAVLHELSIEDKHKGLVTARGAISQAMMSSTFYLEAGTTLDPAILEGAGELVDGAKVGGFRFSQPAKQHGSSTASVMVRATTELDGDEVDLVPLCNILLRDVNAVLMYLYDGPPSDVTIRRDVKPTPGETTS